MQGIEEDDDIVYLTRGDEGEFSFYYPIDIAGDIKNYIFKRNDKITFVVREKNGYNRPIVFKKEFFISEETPYPLIKLNADETKWGKISNKKQVFWFDIILNDTKTIMGFGDKGACKIYLLPDSRREV